MLARLEAVDGLTTAKVDHTGELLRLDVTGGHAVADALMTLRELGYGADELPGAVGVGRWYGRDAVRELSREEGSVIAERVVAAFARLRGMDRAEAERLEAVVAGALSDCFAAHSVASGSVAEGALRSQCVCAVDEVARRILEPEAASALVRALGADLDRPGSAT